MTAPANEEEWRRWKVGYKAERVPRALAGYVPLVSMFRFQNQSPIRRGE